MEAFLYLKQKSLLKEIGLNLLFAFIYFALAKLGLGLATLNNSASPVWPATGFAIAVVYLFGRRFLYAVALGAFLANLTTGTNIFAVVIIMLGNTLEAYVATLFIRWVYRYRIHFTYYSELISTIGSSMLGAIISASLGSAALLILGPATLETIGSIWLTWWIGDTLGGLVVAPLLIHLSKMKIVFKNYFSLVLLLTLTLLVSYFVFISPTGGSYLFLLFPLLLITTKVVGRKFVFFQSAVIGAFGVVATVKGYGPFAIGTLNERLVHLQLFLTMIAVTSVTLAGIGRRRLSLIPSLALLGCWAFSGAIFYSFEKSEEKQTEAHFENLIKHTQEKIEETLVNYENVLRGGTGLYMASNRITADEWRNYSQLLQLTQRHPGMSGLGVIWPVKNSELHLLQKEMKKQGNQNFAIKPVLGFHLSLNTPKDVHYVIKFIEPHDENYSPIGVDIASEPNRKSAADSARDTGGAIITARISILINKVKVPGFHIYLPIYSKYLTSPTLEERQKNHMGWIYSPVTYAKFFTEAFSRSSGELEFQAYEGDSLISDKIVFSNFSKSEFDNQVVTHFSIGQRPFTFRWQKSPNFLSSQDTIVTWVALCGALASLLFTFLVMSLQSLSRRSRALAQQLTKELSASREKFKEGERRLLYALDGSNDGIWDWNIEKSEMYMSGKIADTFGWPQIFYMKTTDDLKEIAHPDDLKAMTNSIKRHFQGLQDSYEVETRYRTKDGVWRWVLTRGKVSERDKNGNPVRMTGVHIDVDAFKKAQELLESTQHQLRKIADSIPTMISEWDVDLNCKFANQGFADWYGFSIEDVLGKNLTAFVSPKDFLNHKDFYQAALKGIPQRYEKEIKRLNQEMRHWVVSCVPHEKNEKIESFFLFVQDVTDLKQAELAAIEERKVALEATSIKSQFLANMSHEIRTPINGIIGMTNLLKATELNPRQREYTDLVSRSSDMLLHLINDILDFSKIEAGKLDLEIINFDLNQLIQDVHQSLSFSASDKSLELKLKNLLPQDSYFKGDPSRLRQVIMNLLSNAIKFTAHGYVALSVEEKQKESGKSRLRFEVRDTGIGIPEASLKRLFQAFSQADATTSRRFGGTGLGLSISKQLVHMMGGEIGVHSAESGSTFWFELSLEACEKPSIEASKNFNIQITKGLRILIAEDNRVNQKIIFETLKGYGYSPHVVGSGVEALDALRESQYDLILMDCQMPEMDGYATTKIIRESRTLNCRDIPIVALTANAIAGDREKCLEVGMNDYISKPMSDIELLKVIEKNLNSSENFSKAKEKIQGHILVVEDNLVNQNVICANLEILNYSFETALNGIEALKVLNDKDFDLILMDCQMPEMDGYEATRRIRRLSSQKKSITPIIALTANALRGDREKCLEAGMNDYLTKPLNVGLLENTLKRWIAEGSKILNEPAMENLVQTTIDFSAIQKIKKLQKPGRPDLISNLIDLFFRSADEGLPQMRLAIQNQNWTALSWIAHSLKSSSANLGAGRFSQLCYKLETSQQFKLSTAEISDIFKLLEKEHQLVITELKGYRIAG